MLDLEGKELEIGSIYMVLGSATHVVVSKYSHETASSFVFKSIKNISNKQGEPVLYSWKRVISKTWSYRVLNNSIAVIRASQDLIDKYQIS